MTGLRLLVPTFLCVLELGACGGAGQPSNRVTVKLPKIEAATPARPIEVQPAQARESLVAPAQAGTDLPRVEPETAEGSRYSSLEPSSCESIGEDHEANVDRRRCAGAAGYALETGGTELHRELTVVSPDGSTSELELSKRVPPGSLGATAEWRGVGRPRALIVRVNAGPDSRPQLSNLIVVKLGDQPCIAAVVPRSRDQNVKARALADREPLDCRSG